MGEQAKKINQKNEIESDDFLGDLADPKAEQFLKPLSLKNYSQDVLLKALEKMLLIRKVEEVIADNVINGTIKCPCHLAIGQEAIAVGVSQFVTSKDFVFGNHRSHAHYLALEASVYELFCEVQGKAEGCSGGMGGSMHLFAEQTGFKGSVPIVAGTVPLAVGAGLAAKLSQKQNFAVTYFGDGAIEEGSVHESLNLASAYHLPVLFVCENNLFSSHLHINIRQPANSLGRYAKAHCIPHLTIDGNNIIEVFDAMKFFSERLRKQEGPAFLEVVTYRWRGHVGPSEDIDVGLKRGDELGAWKKRDPIKRLADGMRAANFLTDEGWGSLNKKIEDFVNEQWKKSLKAPYPKNEVLHEYVFGSSNNK